MDSAAATVLENFRILNDGVKMMLLAMPPVTAFAFTALFLDHYRRKPKDWNKAEEEKGKASPNVPEAQRNPAPIVLPRPAPERQAQMRDIMDEIRARNFTDKKHE